MSDTPRVDAAEYEDDTGGMVVDSKDARTLEQELNAARRTAQYWKDEHLAGNAKLAALQAENAKLKMHAEALVAAIESDLWEAPTAVADYRADFPKEADE